MKGKIKYIIISIMLLFIATSCVYAEQKSILIKGNGDEYGNYPLILDDGSFVVVGQYKSDNIEGIKSNGDYDGYIVKYNQYGEQQWIKSFGGSDYDDFTSVVETSDKGYLVVGEVCSTDIENITLKGNCDALVIKYDQTGNIVYQKTFGTIYEDYFTAIQKANDSTYIVGGLYNKNGTIFKIDELGEVKLEKIVCNNEIFFITTNPKGGYLIGDYTQSSTVKSYDENFNLKWSTSSSDYTYVNDAAVTENGDIIIVGTFADDNRRVAYISKYNQNGVQQWTKEYGSIKETFNAIKIDENGNYKVIGGKKVTEGTIQVSKAIIVTYDSDGNIVSDEAYQHEKSAWFYGADYINKNAYVYVGSSFEQGTSYQDDILIVYNTEAYIYDIVSEVEGKGTIEVVQNATSGEKITFKVNPKEGYELKEIRVTDEEGNVVIFNDYSFTMPTNNVTIKAIFEVKNPNTTTNIVWIVIPMLFLITSIISYKSIKEAKIEKY